MASCVPSAAAAERHRKQRGAADIAHWGVAGAGKPAAAGGSAAADEEEHEVEEEEEEEW